MPGILPNGFPVASLLLFVRKCFDIAAGLIVGVERTFRRFDCLKSCNHLKSPLGNYIFEIIVDLFTKILQLLEFVAKEEVEFEKKGKSLDEHHYRAGH